jgi:hypothetical protein
MIQYSNFSMATYGQFEIKFEGSLAELQLQLDLIHADNAHAPINLKRSSKGKVPSEYVILKHGVYRLSDHWNNVNNSFWLLNGTESTQVCYKKTCIAYCAYKNMEPTFMTFNKMLSGENENLRLQEIIHKTTVMREKQARSQKTLEPSTETILEELFA